MCKEDKRTNKKDCITWSFVCPKCGLKRTHGAGKGHRASHCECWPNGYMIDLEK